jgi:outer membrane protein
MLVTRPSSTVAQSLTLNECLTRAAGSNRSLKVNSYDSVITAQNVFLADSTLFPRIDFQGGYTGQLAEQKIQFNNNTLPTQDADYGFFSLSFSHILYDFGRRSARSQQATLLHEATADRYQGQEKQLFLQVVQGYYDILRARQILLIMADEVTQLGEHLRVAQHLHQQGIVTRNDLLQAEVRLAGSRQRQLSAANEVEKGWLQLNYLTGQPGSFRCELDETPQETNSTGPTDEVAVTSRPEYRAQIKSVQAAEYDVTAERSAFYPELFLKGGIDYVENSMVKEQALYAASLGIRFNIFEGQATTARLRQAVARRSQNEARLNNLTAELQLELDLAGRDAVVSRERIQVTQQSIRQAEENIRINRDRYLEKVGTATEVIDAQTLLTQTRVDYYTALYEYQVAVARVKKARGEL